MHPNLTTLRNQPLTMDPQTEDHHPQSTSTQQLGDRKLAYRSSQSLSILDDLWLFWSDLRLSTAAYAHTGRDREMSSTILTQE